MIHYDSKKVKEIKKWKDDSIYIVTDFDRTLTLGNSKSSWEIFESSFPNKNYVKERNKLTEKYRPIEIDENINEKVKNKAMEEWWKKHLKLLIKNKLTEDMLYDVISDKNFVTLRPGLIEMLTSLNKRNIPIIIISAGIGNFIELFLKANNCYYDNIIILSNFIKFKNNIAIGLENNIIHSLNKNEVSLPKEVQDKLINRKNIILMGDILSDVKMIGESKRKEAFKIALLEESTKESLPLFKEKYDMVCTSNETFFDINKIIKKLI